MCPNCDGRGQNFAFINGGPDLSKHRQEWISCQTCNGSGAVDDEIARRIVIGGEMRQRRVDSGKSLLEASREMGTGPAELSRIERGLGPSAAYPLTK